MKKKKGSYIRLALADKPIKAWALVEDGTLSHHYGLCFIVYRKKQAEAEARYKNGYPFFHHMAVRECEIRIKPFQLTAGGNK